MIGTGWRSVWPGLCALLVGIGLGRFAYTPMIPSLVSHGWLSPSEAAYVGAANLLGYFIGALGAAPIARRVGLGPTIRICLAATVATFALCAIDAGVWWLMPWRLLSGITGVTLMVLAPSYLLVRVAPAERGRAGGLVLTGVGLGAALGAVVVGPLSVIDPAVGWLGLTALGGLAALVTWGRWRLPIEAAPPAAAAKGPAVMTAPLVLALAAYAVDGAGFVPHTIFWVDFIARELALGIGLGTLNWMLFGLGAAVGPMTVGAIADRLGLARTLTLVFGTKAALIALPAFAPTPALLALSSIVVGALTPGVASLTASRIAELVPPAAQARSWAIATLAFGIGQVGSAYGMSFAFSRIGSYRPLYGAAAAIEAAGFLAALAAAWIFPRRTRLQP